MTSAYRRSSVIEKKVDKFAAEGNDHREVGRFRDGWGWQDRCWGAATKGCSSWQFGTVEQPDVTSSTAIQQTLRIDMKLPGVFRGCLNNQPSGLGIILDLGVNENGSVSHMN